MLKQNFVPKELERRMAAELWFYPDGSRILELSTKCTAADTFQVAAEARAYLTAKGVTRHGRQQTKTKAALTFFSKQFRDAAPLTPSGSPDSRSRSGSRRPRASAGFRARARRGRPSASARGGAGSTS